MSTSPKARDLVVVVARDLIVATRIGDAARAAGQPAVRVDEPGDLPRADRVRVAFVDWGESARDWGAELADWRASADPPPRLVIFGSHMDLVGHGTAREAGIGPVVARSKLFATLHAYLA